MHWIYFSWINVSVSFFKLSQTVGVLMTNSYFDTFATLECNEIKKKK